MSAVTTQPLPLGRLEREQHIQMIFRSFHNRCGPCECRAHLPRPRALRPGPGWDTQEPLSVQAPDKKTERSSGQEAMEREEEEEVEEEEEEEEEQNPGPDFLSVLETVSQIHITARPELQGPQCVPRKIYSLDTRGSRSQLFVAVEETSCVCLQCCGPARACTLKGFDCRGGQVFYFEKPLRADACCLGCCLMEMRVYTPQKHLIGTVCQRWSMFTPLLEVCDADGAAAARIQGSCCPCRCLANQQFQIESNIGEKLGTVWKRWPGFNEECNMDHEYFGLEVTPSMRPNIKLLLLATTFLLNHMFFEMS